jgi:hypothetical protein
MNQKRIKRDSDDYYEEDPLHEDYESEFLDALVTVLFIKQELPDLFDDDILRRLKETRGYINDKILIIALNTAKKLTFKEEYLSDEIQEELDLWDRVED